MSAIVCDHEAAERILSYAAAMPVRLRPAEPGGPHGTPAYLVDLGLWSASVLSEGGRTAPGTRVGLWLPWAPEVPEVAATVADARPRFGPLGVPGQLCWLLCLRLPSLCPPEFFSAVHRRLS